MVDPAQPMPEPAEPRVLQRAQADYLYRQLLEVQELLSEHRDRPPTIGELRAAMAAGAGAFLFFADELQFREGVSASRNFAVFTMNDFLSNLPPPS